MRHLRAVPPLPEPQITVRQMGREGEPPVVIGGFCGQVDALLEAADPRKGRLTINMFLVGE